MQEDEFLVWCAGSLISCCSPNWEVMPSMFEPLCDVLPLLHQRSDLTWKSPRTTVKKGYFLKLNQDLVQGFSEMFKIHLEIGLVNDIKQWNYIFFPRFSFQSWCTLVGIECLLLSTEENFYSRYKRHHA